MSPLLDQLCDLYGVLPHYHDIWGRIHYPSDAVKRALLAAMGVPADSDDEIARSLHLVRRREWERSLPFVQVVREPARPHRIVMVLPASEDGVIYRWCLYQESGKEDRGEFDPASLLEVESHRLDGQDLVKRAFVLDLPVEPGYHRFHIERLDGAGAPGQMSFIVAPAACYVPPAMQGSGRVWGMAAQLYGVRSAHNWGIGDYGDLRRMIELCAEVGAGTVLVNPLHAPFLDAPEHASPYSPSSRTHFNAFYLDLESIPDYTECTEAKALVRSPPFQAMLRALRASAKVDYRGIAAAKLQVLELAYQHFRTAHLERHSERARDFRAFQGEQGEPLRWQSLYEALQEHFHAQDSGIWGWPAWPKAYHDKHAPEVADFCEANLVRVEFYEYLHWQTSSQLAAAGTRSWELGLGVGIMLDLAVGVAEGGADTWAQRNLYALNVSTGAPPDEINHLGQDWGLPPWIPHQLAALAYAPYIQMLRANMRDSGALRIDHVMGLQRLFWVARGLAVSEGAYVSYPFDDLLGILALESQRNRCLVVGEDLGTVPAGIRQALEPMNVLSTRLLYFERRDDGQFSPPSDYPVKTMAAVTTHDLPTLAGFWQGLDIELRDRLHLFPDDEARNRQVVARSEERARLLLALEGEGILPQGSSLQPVAFPEMNAELASEVHAYLARAPSKLLMVQMTDALGVPEQPNLPGTTEPTYPCWRLKLPLNLDEWRGNAYFKGVLAPLRQERPVRQLADAAGGAVGEGLRSWIPRATYRLQLHRDFNLRQAMKLISYLDELGISHCYLSPLLKARPGSRHGYDITDHSSLNSEIASAEDFEQFTAMLKRHGMGQIMDMVPNHMGVMGADNAWWLDVLENGPASRFAGYFDIDWHPMTEDLPGKVLLPVLGDHYGTVLENGKFTLVFDADLGEFSVFYFEHRFPVDPREYPRILNRGLERLQARLGANHPSFLEFQTLVTAFRHLPSRYLVSQEEVAERARDKEVHKHHLASLFATSADIGQFIDENIAEFNGAGSEDAGRFDPMHELLQAQAYRLAFWRVAADEINYRRFFDIHDLAALRMENPEVFEATHHLIRKLLARGYVNGLRIDHPDGLYAPREYFDQIQAMAASLAGASSDLPTDVNARPLYVVVEKILAPYEHLPQSWPIHGTTGYDFAAACGGLFVNGNNADRFTRIYQRFVRALSELNEMMRANKHMIMETALAGELQVLATQLNRIAKADRHTCDFTLNALRGALADIVAGFPVYRTYIAGCQASPDDKRYVDWAVGVAKKRSTALDTSIFDFVRDVLLAKHGQDKSEEYRQAASAFTMKFQQYCSPVMAKAVEDTTFYQYNRLVSLNEVGGAPDHFGVSVAAFHRENLERARHWPHAMLSSSTHDSKRSEDVRARISVLSEIPEAWNRVLMRWNKQDRSKRRKLETGFAPSRNDEYLLYQTLLGIWPFDMPDSEGMTEIEKRIEQYMVKAVREAKVHSSWINPDSQYEDATRNFIHGLLSPDPANIFLRDFLAFQEQIAWLGAFNSLSQLLIKLTSPGVPDIYQGNEMWEFSLVDPDNRRPVDYPMRRKALRSIKTLFAEKGAAACAQELLGNLQDGRIKLYLTWKILTFRKSHEQVFREGDYLPLTVHGKCKEHACVFGRQSGNDMLIVMAPRLFSGLIREEKVFPVGHGIWGDTWAELPPDFLHGQWLNVLNGQLVGTRMIDEGNSLPLAQVFDDIPFALLQPVSPNALP